MTNDRPTSCGLTAPHDAHGYMAAGVPGHCDGIPNDGRLRAIPDDPETRAWAKAAVAGAPKLTPSQIARLRVLFRRDK